MATKVLPKLHSSNVTQVSPKSASQPQPPPAIDRFRNLCAGLNMDYDTFKQAIVKTKKPTTCSPLKCLKNFNASPQKKLPSVLMNPLKRRQTKKIRLNLLPDEDANHEMPDQGIKSVRDWTQRNNKTPEQQLVLKPTNNYCSIYQHPYFAGFALYPRKISNLANKLSDLLPNMHKEWIESVDDIVNLFIGNQCPYFFLCGENYEVFFHIEDEHLAHIVPFSPTLSNELTRNNIKFKTTGTVEPKAESNDDDDSDDEDTSVFLEEIGLSQQDFPSLMNSSQASKTTGQRPSAVIEGKANIMDYIKFLKKRPQTGLPATLLAPRQFKLSTFCQPNLLPALQL